jgi:hypothetical protein
LKSIYFKGDSGERRLSEMLGEGGGKVSSVWDETGDKRNLGGSIDYHMTLEEIGNEMGVSETRIQQIIAKALRKLQDPKRNKPLKGLI